MANSYVRSTDGSDADNGSTWALAKATVAGAASGAAAGDTINVSQAHAETSAAAVTIALGGTNANPVNLLCVNDAAEPPTALDTSGEIATTGTGALTIHGAAFIRGLTFSCGSGAVNTNLNVNPYNSNSNKRQTYEQCSFIMGASGSSTSINVNGNVGANNTDNSTLWHNCHIKSAALSAFAVRVFGRFVWKGGSVLPGHVGSSKGLIGSADSAGEGSFGDFAGLDLTNMGASQALFQSTPSTARFVIRNSKLPPGWTGNLVSGAINVADRYEMHNCDSADTNYRLWIEDYYGSVKSETTVVRTNGANDGTTAFAWRITSSANVNYPLAALITPDVPVRWNSVVGTPITITVEILHDSLTPLRDDEIWLDVQHLGTSGFPMSTFTSDAKANILAAAANHAASTEAWTTTGMTNPNRQKLSVTVTPQEAGYLQAKVHLAKAGYTVFIDPKLAVS